MKYTLLITMLLCSIKLFSPNNDSLHTQQQKALKKDRLHVFANIGDSLYFYARIDDFE